MVIQITYQDKTRRIIRPNAALMNPKPLIKGDLPFERKVVDLAESTGDPLLIEVHDSDKSLFFKKYKTKYEA